MRLALPCVVTALAASPAFAQGSSRARLPGPPHPPVPFEAPLLADTVRGPLRCATYPGPFFVESLRAAVGRGEVADPRNKPRAGLSPAARGTGAPGVDCPLSSAQIHLYEDTGQVLTGAPDIGAILSVMSDAVGDVHAHYGDNFDFVGVWTNQPVGGAWGTSLFYVPLFNTIEGIGNPSLRPESDFDYRPNYGIGGENMQGMVMLWDVNFGFYEPGGGANAKQTRLFLSHEFGHRWTCYLPPLAGGLDAQGSVGSCGSPFHWNYRLDAQGSCLLIGSWTGTNPALPKGNPLSFNSDTGGAYSWLELYLMGLAEPAEVEASMAEFRYMDQASCSGSYFGPITSLSMADVVATAGPRVPSAAESTKHWRIGWVMIHQPGSPPTQAELDKAAAIVDTRTADYDLFTLGRGSVDQTLFDDCNCNDVPDRDDIAGGSSPDSNHNAVPDECEALGTPFCGPAVPSSTGAPSVLDGLGCASVLANDVTLRARQLPSGEPGYLLASLSAGFVANPGGSAGNLCLGGQVARFTGQIASSGPAGEILVPVDLVDIPTHPPVAVQPGETWRFQLWYRDAATSNFSDGLEVAFK